MDLIFEKKHSASYGHYLVSKKSYQIGEKIFEEAPLLVAPHHDISSDMDSSKFLCVGCYKKITRENAVRCGRCSWYACCEQCTDEPWHKNFECGVFVKKNVDPSLESLKLIYLVRAFLYRETDASKFNQFLNLSSVVQIEDSKLKLYFDKHTNDAFLFLNNQCEIFVEAGLVKTLIKTFFVNRFGMMSRDKAENRYNGEAIFCIGSMFAHSCSPNADWILLPTDEEDVGRRWCLTVCARREIKTGDMITIPYSSDNMMYGTLARRLQIIENFRFGCKCQRCSDESECGTNFCGIKCEQCSGVLLPEKPLEIYTNWKCATCNKILTMDAVKNLEDIFNDKLEVILEAENKDSSCEQLDILIEEGSAKYGLHPNHKLIVEATMQWLSRVNFSTLEQMGSEADKLFAIMKSRAKQCLKVCSAIGALTNWVTCEVALALITIKYKFKSRTRFSIDYDNYTLEEKITIIKRIVKHFLRGLRLIKGTYTSYDAAYGRVLKNTQKGYQIWRKHLEDACREAQITNLEKELLDYTL